MSSMLYVLRGLLLSVAAGTFLMGCRDEVVLTIEPPRSVDGQGEGTFSGKAGIEYVVWLDFFIDPSISDNGPSHCYENVLEVIQDEKVVATTTCPFPVGGTCVSKSGNSGGDCKTKCAFRLKDAGQTTVRSRLEKRGPCRSGLRGIADLKKELKKYKLKIEQPD